MAEVPITVVPSRGEYNMPLPSGESDYRATLYAALAARTAADEPRDLIFPPGEYHFTGPLDTTTNPSHWDNFSLIGAPCAGTRQHLQEAGNGNDLRRRVNFIFHLENDETALDIQRDYRFGPITIEGIEFTIERGNGFNFGDPNEADDAAVTMRGLKLDCMINTDNHYGSSDTGDGRAWLIDAGADGYLINQTERFGLRMSHCYDVELNVNVRGFRYGVINNDCDQPRGNVIGLTNGRTLWERGTAGVAASWVRVTEENPLLGSVIRGGVMNFRTELNEVNYVEPPGGYVLPSTVNWTLTAGDDEIVFSSWDGAYDARDYFAVDGVIVLDPATSNEPNRKLVVSSVAANNVGFYYADGKNYVGRTITGTGANITRYFGTSLGIGDRLDIAQRSTISNVTGLDAFAVAPDSTPIRVAANSAGRGIDANDLQQPVIVGSCVGQEDHVMGVVDLIGTAGYLPHPLVTRSDVKPPKFDRRTRDCIYFPPNPITGDGEYWVAEPGRGVSSINNCARDLTIHPLTEANGEATWGYRPSDCSVGWQIRDSRLAEGVITNVHARVYSAAGATVSCFGGAGATESDTASAGWDDVTFQLEANQVDADGNGPYVQIGGTGFFVSRVWIEQE